MGLSLGTVLVGIGLLLGGGGKLGLGEVGVDLGSLAGELSLGGVEGNVGLVVPGRGVVLLIHINDYEAIIS